jgi:hypothetical protein
MRRIGIAAAVLAAAGIAGTGVVTTTHAAGLPLPILGGTGNGLSSLPVIGSLPGLDGSDPVSGVIGGVAGLPGYVLDCGVLANVPILQHAQPSVAKPATRRGKSHKATPQTTLKAIPEATDCSQGLPIVSSLPVVGGLLGNLPNGGLGGVVGGLPIVGDGSAIGGLTNGLPIGSLVNGLPVGSLLGSLPVGGLLNGLPVGGLTNGLSLGGLLGG